MSPTLLARRHIEQGFPRVSGDEPGATSYSNFDVSFSPRERG